VTALKVAACCVLHDCRTMGLSRTDVLSVGVCSRRFTSALQASTKSAQMQNRRETCGQECPTLKQGCANSESQPKFGSRDLPLWVAKYFRFSLHFTFAVLIKQNKCNCLLFHVLSFTEFCARKLLQLIVVLKMIFMYKVFSTKLCAHEMFWSRQFENIF